VAYPATVYRILIGGPSDALEIRTKARDVLTEWNQQYSKNEGIILLPSTWELDSWPAYGDHPQSLINKQMVDNCDAMIAIFKSHVGTPTVEHISGTVEELHKIHESGKPVMLYLYAGDIPQHVARSTEYQRYAQFEAELKTQGLYSRYSSADEFTTSLKSHLSKLARSLPRLALMNPPQHESEVTSQPDETDTPIPNESSEWWAILFADNQPDETTFKRTREAFYESAANAPEESSGTTDFAREEIGVLALLAMKGDDSALGELESKDADPSMPDEVRSSLHLYLSQVYAHHGSVALAHERAEMAVSSAQNAEDRANAVSVLAQTVFSMNERAVSYTLLKNEISATKDRKVASKLALDLSELFGNDGKRMWQVLAMELAMSKMPENHDKRFLLAHAYSSEQLPLMALLHYTRLLRRKPNHATALNNLGAELSGLSLRALAIERYQEAVRNGSALAAANLAHVYIDAGFHADAQRFIETAEKLGDEARIHAAKVRLLEEKASQEQLLETHRQRTAAVSALLVNAAEGMINTDDIDISGQWRSEDDISVEITQNGTMFSGKWSKIKRTYSVQGTIMGHSLVIESINWRSEDSLYSSNDTVVQGSYGLFSPARQTLTLLTGKGSPAELWTLRREMPESI